MLRRHWVQWFIFLNWKAISCLALRFIFMGLYWYTWVPFYILIPNTVYYYPVLHITTPCSILLPCAAYYYTMQYIITLCCILLHHAVYYYPVLYIITPCCILLPCSLYYYIMLYITTLCCILLPCAVYYYLLLCIITAGCMLFPRAVYYDFFSGPLLVLNQYFRIFSYAIKIKYLIWYWWSSSAVQKLAIFRTKHRCYDCCVLWQKNGATQYGMSQFLRWNILTEVVACRIIKTASTPSIQPVLVKAVRGVLSH
jgi:hypothetical protein